MIENHRGTHIPNKRHIFLIFSVGSILVLDLYSNDRASFFKLRNKTHSLKWSAAFFKGKIKKGSGFTIRGLTVGMSLSKYRLTAFTKPGYVVLNRMSLSCNNQLENMKRLTGCSITLNNSLHWSCERNSSCTKGQNHKTTAAESNKK